MSTGAGTAKARAAVEADTAAQVAEFKARKLAARATEAGEKAIALRAKAAEAVEIAAAEWAATH